MWCVSCGCICERERDRDFLRVRNLNELFNLRWSIRIWLEFCWRMKEHLVEGVWSKLSFVVIIKKSLIEIKVWLFSRLEMILKQNCFWLHNRLPFAKDVINCYGSLSNSKQIKWASLSLLSIYHFRECIYSVFRGKSSVMFVHAISIQKQLKHPSRYLDKGTFSTADVINRFTIHIHSDETDFMRVPKDTFIQRKYNCTFHSYTEQMTCQQCMITMIWCIIHYLDTSSRLQ